MTGTGTVFDIIDSDIDEEVVEEVVEETPLPPSKIVIKLSSRGCGILFGGRERVGLADEVEYKYRVKIKGIDRQRNVSGCCRRVEVSSRWGWGMDGRSSDVIGAVLQLFEDIPVLAGGNALKYPAISW